MVQTPQSLMVMEEIGMAMAARFVVVPILLLPVH